MYLFTALVVKGGVRRGRDERKSYEAKERTNHFEALFVCANVPRIGVDIE